MMRVVARAADYYILYIAVLILFFLGRLITTRSRAVLKTQAV